MRTDVPIQTLRRLAHAAFDPLWQDRTPRGPLDRANARNPREVSARRRAYQWLAHQLGKPVAEVHIADLPAAELRRVLEVSSKHTYALVQSWRPTPEETEGDPNCPQQ